MNSSICFSSFPLVSLSLLNTCFFNLRSSSLNWVWCSYIFIAASFNSSYIFSFVSLRSSLTLLTSPLRSKSLVSRLSVRVSISKSNLVLRSPIWSLTLTKSSSITLNVFPIHEKSGTSLTSLTHFGNLGIAALTSSIAPHIATISAS